MRKNANVENPGCYERLGKYDVIFFDPITHERILVAICKNLEEAKEKYLEYQLEYYSQHPYLLPKYIGVKKGKFTVDLHYKVKFDKEFRRVYLGAFDSLQAAENAKLEFITNLL